MLQKLGFEVEVANNGKEAEKLYFDLESNVYCIILDCEMPVQNGLTTAKRIRARDKKVPILMLTAHSTEKDKEDCLLAGASGFLTKPVSIQTLNQYFSSLTIQ